MTSYPLHLIDAAHRHGARLTVPGRKSALLAGAWVTTMSVRILLVDDSPQVRTLIRFSIEQNTDWTVCGEAENGNAALTMAASLRPHFVVLDLAMPGMNGLETARRISGMSPGLPMIMFTMHESRMLEDEAHAAGITHVFSKEQGFGDNVFKATRAMLAAATTSRRQSQENPAARATSTT